MKVLGNKPKIAIKNILFATDFGVLANRALPFAVALADRYGREAVCGPCHTSGSLWLWPGPSPWNGY